MQLTHTCNQIQVIYAILLVYGPVFIFSSVANGVVNELKVEGRSSFHNVIA